MSNTSTGTNTMSKSTSAPVAKKVSKKSDAVVEAVAAPVAEKVVKKAASKAAAPAAAPGDAAPVASNVAAEAAPVEAKSVEQEIAALISTHQQIRDQSVAAIKTLQRLQKRVAKDLKEAGRRKRRGTKVADENGAPKEKRPTIFTTPVTLKDPLCAFLGKPKGSQMTPADVTRAFSAYVDSKKLKDAEKGHTIHPDEAMRKVLGVSATEVLTYRNIQSYLYKLYVLPEKKKPASA
jgi:chromatin remodeling complex protein RSC6